ncbi:hypothetical protein UFOVP649_90 [uncultured Caudovirales phage]|uniref:Uncharacterized protein n=1 Tax=uncultured Caudovirales phage TaxID=2100421 RepID=A0A6J5NDF4_9CAUD|nr:hypothetical protein UFOVP649_90 [uncultured Caudovirales phage]
MTASCHFGSVFCGIEWEKPRQSLAIVQKALLCKMKFGIPVEMVYNGKTRVTVMGPFEHSPQREFALVVNKKAIADCSDMKKLKEVAHNLLVGWSSMQTALQSMMLENMQLRQAMDKRDVDLEAANAIIEEASLLIDQYTQQLNQTKKGLWSWWK